MHLLQNVQLAPTHQPVSVSQTEEPPVSVALSVKSGGGQRRQKSSPLSKLSMPTEDGRFSGDRIYTASDGEQMLESNDKDGWCRNKKYIDRVDDEGYRCCLCKKVYGRYNSVSYHVTIYHRNPPIRCDKAGCQFTTREARYIHFHKYYRHNIALPDSIDQQSRKCILCRHVAKSPAMLEKHLARHIPDCVRVCNMYRCPKCLHEASTYREMAGHIVSHSDGQVEQSSLLNTATVKAKLKTAGKALGSTVVQSKRRLNVQQRVDLARASADSNKTSSASVCPQNPSAFTEMHQLTTHFQQHHQPQSPITDVALIAAQPH